MDGDTHAALDAAIGAHVRGEGLVDNGEIILSWLVLVGTRTPDDGGATITLVSDDGMPTWQAKGLLTEALDLTRNQGGTGAA